MESISITGGSSRPAKARAPQGEDSGISLTLRCEFLRASKGLLRVGKLS